MSSYNEVQATKLGRKDRKKRKTAPPPAAAGAPAAAWPPELQDFVNSSFARAETLSEAQKALFNTQIQTLIYTAAQSNKLWTNDWRAQRLPVFDPAAPLQLAQDVPSSQPSSFQSPQSQSSFHSPQFQSPQFQDLPSKPAPGATAGAQFDSSDRKRQRAARFGNPGRSSPSPAPQASRTAQVVGTSTALEKRYLRLTSEPDPAMVRPEHVLEQCLDFVMEKYRSTGASYSYINDQLKAIRQDLTVQHISNDLAIAVYETHGRVAIENNDLGEFNQCQSQLKHLYDSKPASFFQHTYEFTCYRILYLLLTANHADACLIKLELIRADPARADQDPYNTHRDAVYRALQLLDAVTTGDYHGFFRTYRWFQQLDAMPCAFHLLDQFMANKQRLLTLNVWCKAFKKLPAAYLAENLALESVPRFLADFSLGQYAAGADFDCAAARGALQQIVDRGTFKKVDIKGQV